MHLGKVRRLELVVAKQNSVRVILIHDPLSR